MTPRASASRSFPRETPRKARRKTLGSGQQGGSKVRRGPGSPAKAARTRRSPAKASSSAKTRRPRVKAFVRDAVDGDELLGRAERVIEQARSRGLAQAECYMEWGEGLEVELEKGKVANTGAGQGGGGSVRVVVDGRIGFAYFTDAANAPQALEQAVAASRHGEALGYSLPAGGRLRRLPGRWDPEAAAMDVERAIAMAKDLVAGAREAAPKALLSGGGVGIDAEWMALASSEGVACWDRDTGVSTAANLVLKDGRRSVSASESAASHRLDVDGHTVGLEAGRTVLALRKPAKPAKGVLQVLFRPTAAAELVSDFVVAAAVGDEARRGKTVWSGRLGAEVASPLLDVTDDSFAAGAVGGAPFDAEGQPTRRLPIVSRGVLRTYLYDSVDARRHGASSTRSAVRADFKGRPSTGTHHVTVAGTKPRPLSRLVAAIDDGYLVDSVLGAHTANATTGDFSVTAPNVWRVRGGELAGPVKDIAIGGSLPDLLRRLEGVSREAKVMEGLRMPHLLFRDVDVSA